MKNFKKHGIQLFGVFKKLLLVCFISQQGELLTTVFKKQST